MLTTHDLGRLLHSPTHTCSLSWQNHWENEGVNSYLCLGSTHLYSTYLKGLRQTKCLMTVTGWLVCKCRRHMTLVVYFTHLHTRVVSADKTTERMRMWTRTCVWESTRLYVAYLKGLRQTKCLMIVTGWLVCKCRRHMTLVIYFTHLHTRVVSADKTTERMRVWTHSSVW